MPEFLRNHRAGGRVALALFDAGAFACHDGRLASGQRSIPLAGVSRPGVVITGNAVGVQDCPRDIQFRVPGDGDLGVGFVRANEIPGTNRARRHGTPERLAL